MAGSPPNLHTMDSRSACIQVVLKVKVKGHVIRALFWILGMSYSVIDGLVLNTAPDKDIMALQEILCLVYFQTKHATCEASVVYIQSGLYVVPCNAVLSQGFLSINLEMMNCLHALLSQLSISYAL